MHEAVGGPHSRRAFLRLSLIGLGATSAASLMAACGPAAAPPSARASMALLSLARNRSPAFPAEEISVLKCRPSIVEVWLYLAPPQTAPAIRRASRLTAFGG